MTATDELAQHEQRVSEAQKRVQALARDAAEMAAKVSGLKEQRIGAYAYQDERKAAQLSKKIADAEVKQEEVAERRSGAELAVRRAAGEHQAFVAKRYRDVISEVEPAARRAAQAVDDATDTLLTALSEWEAVKGRVAAVLHTAGQTNQRVPSLEWEEISKALRRRPQPTPVPLPGFATAISVVPEHDPDSEVRERARQEIREKSAKGA